jgi:hypothetical protein
MSPYAWGRGGGERRVPHPRFELVFLAVRATDSRLPSSLSYSRVRVTSSTQENLKRFIPSNLSLAAFWLCPVRMEVEGSSMVLQVVDALAD